MNDCGQHVFFSILVLKEVSKVTKETLLDAQAHPEKYKTLVVRVAGYSALFTTLSRSLQNDIINRTEQDGMLVKDAKKMESLVVKDDTVAEASVVIDHRFDERTRKLDLTVRGEVVNTQRTAYLLTILSKDNR